MAVASRDATAPAASVSPAECSCALQGPLQIRDVTERAAELRQALAAGIRHIDLGGITVIDTAGLQLLVAVAREPAQNGGRVTLGNAGAVVMPAAAALGLDVVLAPLCTEAA